MKKASKKIKLLIHWTLLFTLLIFSLFRGGVGQAYAAETEGGGLMQELETLTVDGKKFNAADYPVKAEGAPQLLNLGELGYGSNAYGLVLYVYNPAQLELKGDVLNTVQMRVGNEKYYSKYGIKLIDWTADMLFYKFRVDFTDDERSAVLAALDGSARTYEISSIELYIKGYNATDYPVERAYTYTGYGDELGQTVKYVEYDGVETKRIEVHHTSWSPYGTNGTKNMRDTVHSVYFAVSKELDEQYDYLKSIKVEYLRARTNTTLVTSNEAAYNALKRLQTTNASHLSPYDDGSDGEDGEKDTRPLAPKSFKFHYNSPQYYYAWGFRADSDMSEEVGVYFADKLFGLEDGLIKNKRNLLINIVSNDNPMRALYLAALSGDDGVVTSSEVEQMIKDTTENGVFYNDKKVAGKYPSHLFSSYDEGKTTKTLSSMDEKLELTGGRYNQTFWERLFGLDGSEFVQQLSEQIDVIQEVTDADISATKGETSKKLYISERDEDEFKSFYEANKADNKVYILRFATSESYSEPVVVYEKDADGAGVWYYYEKDYKAYYAQTEAFLDFDIIYFEYAKGAETFVIPVSMSPIDIFTEMLPPPVYYDFTWYAIGTIAGLIVFYVVYKLVRKAVKEK